MGFVSDRASESPLHFLKFSLNVSKKTCYSWTEGPKGDDRDLFFDQTINTYLQHPYKDYKRHERFRISRENSDWKFPYPVAVSKLISNDTIFSLSFRHFVVNEIGVCATRNAQFRRRSLTMSRWKLHASTLRVERVQLPRLLFRNYD